MICIDYSKYEIWSLIITTLLYVISYNSDDAEPNPFSRVAHLPGSTLQVVITKLRETQYNKMSLEFLCK
jgi:hypothetical protein